VAEPEVGSDSLASDGKESSGPVQRTAITVGGASTEPIEEDDDDAARPLPGRLIIELTAHRTLALRDALAEHPSVAFQAVLATFYRFASSGSCLEIAVHTPTFPAQAPGLKESVSAKAIDTRHEAWKAAAPER
jgi:ParB family transcriptional regulator, chromosome partitioning protein